MNEIKDLEDILQKINDTVITTIARRIGAIGRLSSYELSQSINIMRFYNEDLQHIEERIAKLTKLGVKEIDRIFKESAKAVGMEVAEQFGGEYKMTQESKALRDSAIALATGTLLNLSKTSVMELNGIPIRGAYINFINKAILTAASGVGDYYSQMRQTIKAMGNGVTVEGRPPRVTYASGHKRRLDSAVRMNILDGLRKMSREVRKSQAAEFGADGVYIMPHALCAEDHRPYQGHEYTYAEFEELNGRLRRPIATGTWNCGHVAYDRHVGDPLPYTADELAEINAFGAGEVTWNGKTMTRYQASQRMRAAETRIRTLKQIRNGYAAEGDTLAESEFTAYIKEATSKYKERCKECGLPPEPKRMGV